MRWVIMPAHCRKATEGGDVPAQRATGGIQTVVPFAIRPDLHPKTGQNRAVHQGPLTGRVARIVRGALSVP
jgi:hypothetical protein